MSWARLQVFGITFSHGFCMPLGGGGVSKIFLAFLFTLHASSSEANPAPQAPLTQALQHKNLEESIWLADVDQLDQLEKSAARIVQMDPYSGYGHYLLAELYLKQFKQNPSQLRLLRQSSELAQQAIELNPKEDYGYIVSAQVLDLMGYTDNALAILDGDSNSPIQPSWRVDFIRGQLLSGQSPESEILIDFEASLQAKDSSPNIIIPYVIATLQSGSQGPTLIEELRTWRKKYPSRLFDLSLAMALSDNKQYGEAHKIYAQLQKNNPGFVEAYINDGIILYNHLKRPHDAKTVLMSLVNSHLNLDSQRKTIVRAHLGKINLEHFRNYEEARKNFLEAIATAKNPMEWIAFAHKAYETNQRLRDFVVLLDELRPRIPGSSYLYALEGEVLSESLAMHERAVESFNSAIILDPDRSEFYNGLGLTYYRMHQLDRALSVFHEASKLDPQDATSRYNEACVLAIMGRPSEALGSLREAIVLDPRLQQTARLDKDFSSIRVTEQFQSLTTKMPVTAGP